jgi:protein-disulfide isomerase
VSADGLRSAAVPGAAADDWIRGPAGAERVVIEYADFECPYCAVLDARLAVALELRRALELRWVFRHFPVKSAHPRALAAACAAEAAGRQGRFWEMHDALFADQARLEDPHLWERARAIGLDLERFDADRRGEAVRARVDASFRAGIRAGVVTTPTVFLLTAGSEPVMLDEPGLERLLVG